MAKEKPVKKAVVGGNQKGSSSYGAKDIFVLEGLEPVRKRPGMYIGTTGPDGLHHLIREVVDNSIDEAMAGYAKNITVELLPGNVVAVTDDGRGIPVEKHPQTKKSTLETVLTTLHAGGKFGGEGYKVSGGLHGVGVSVVNALSEWMKAEVYRDGDVYMQEYKRGVAQGKVKNVGKSKGTGAPATGTKITFTPDPQIFTSGIEFNDKQIIDRLRQQAYLTKSIRINFYDRRSAVPVFYGFYFEGGLLSFVKYLAKGKNRLHEDIFYVEKEAEKMDIEVAFLYIDDTRPAEMSFANTIVTPDGGTHLTGFRSALTRQLNNFARTEGYLKEKEENLTSEDMREGLVSIVSVKLGNPQFEGQTKNRLGNPEAQTATQAVVGEALKEFLEKHPQEAKAILAKVILTSKARLAAKAARETVLRKGAFEGMTLPGKLADCSSKSAEESELFIVEGDSAGGCFSGDTQVALADGRNVSFKELVAEDQAGKKNHAYTMRDDGEVAIAPILHPRRTKKNAEVVKVALDNGEVITCTPDHRFMLRDGSYKEAGKLIADDSLMPHQHDNHNVISIERLTERIDVYDIEIPETHNFALASGVFVHNSAKQGRDRRTQAILPLRGKILNVERARLDKMLANAEVRALVIAIGTAIGEEFDMEKLRYHKIVIMTDADVDGAHIRTLLLTLFYRHFTKVVEGGYIYIAQPPLYRIQLGKSVRYAFSDPEKDKIIGEMQKASADKADAKAAGKAAGKSAGKKEKIVVTDAASIADAAIAFEDLPSTTSEDEVVLGGGVGTGDGKRQPNIQRYKGLGEMNADQLWETTMNPETRSMLQVTIEDAEHANKLFDILMGDAVEPRKNFIQANAANVKNLDLVA